MKSIKTNRKIAIMVYTVITMLVTTAVAIGVYEFNRVGTLTINEEKMEIQTKSSTVGELLEEQNIILKQDDYISQAVDSQLQNDFNIEIRRSVPVILNFKDKEVKIDTTEKTVKDVLHSLSITYDKDDKITPELKTKLVADMQITIVEFEEKTKTVEEEIAFQVDVKENSKLASGETLVVQEGIKGVRTNKVKETYENGKLVKTDVIETTVVREPIKQIVQKGTKINQNLVASRGGSPSYSPSAVPTSGGSRSIMMNASAYDLSYASCRKNPGDPYYGITASGTKVRPGVVAVDTNVIPFGTKLKIEGFGDRIFTAEDRGGAIKGNKIDIFMESGVYQFGRRNLMVYILD